MSTDEEALLASIDATPLDQAPRLIYADWLQEHGDETKAEYLRAVVALLNPPEDKAIVQRLLALAPSVDVSWRQRVGSRFEVSLDSNATLLALQNLFGISFNWAFYALAQLRDTGKPVLLKSGLTREGAADLINSLMPDLPAENVEHVFRFVIAPMKEVSSIGLFL